MKRKRRKQQTCRYCDGRGRISKLDIAISDAIDAIFTNKDSYNDRAMLDGPEKRKHGPGQSRKKSSK